MRNQGVYRRHCGIKSATVEIIGAVVAKGGGIHEPTAKAAAVSCHNYTSSHLHSNMKYCVRITASDIWYCLCVVARSKP